MVFAHLEPFCSKHGVGLGRFTEQTFERVHSKWNEYSRYRLHGEVSHPEYGSALLQAVKDLNVLNLT